MSSNIDERPDLVTITYHGLGISCFTDPIYIYRDPLRQTERLLRLPVELAAQNRRKPLQVARYGAHETAILRYRNALEGKNHILKIEIRGLDQTGVVREAFLFPTTTAQAGPATAVDRIPDDARISIRATQGAGLTDCRAYSPAASLNRLNPTAADDYDLRWIPDIEGAEFHNGPLQTRAHTVPITELHIENAEFYCRKICRDPQTKIETKVKPVGNALAATVTSEPFGRIGYELGAKIPAVAAEIAITHANGYREVCELKAKTVGGHQIVRYQIVITNLDPKGDLISDFPVYYEVLRDGAARSFNVDNTNGLCVPAAPDFKEIGGTVNIHKFCGKVYASTKTGAAALVYRTTAAPDAGPPETPSGD